jgi:predicted nucleic acid-binding protein
MVRVILDTNALLQTFPRKSPKHWIFQYFLEKRYELIVTTDILLEYHEIIARQTNTSIAENLVNGMIRRSNCKRVEPTFFWNLMTKDPDDNKFTDAYMAGQADLLISNNSSDFKVLKNIEFPKIHWVTVAQAKKSMFLRDYS